MTDEKRMLEAALKEVDSKFAEYGLLEDINAFCASEEALAIVQKTIQKLISNMKKIEDWAPVGTKEAAELMREALETTAGDEIRKDAINNFKIRFFYNIEVMKTMFEEMADNTVEDEMKKLMIDSIKKGIPAAGIKDMKEICQAMLKKNTNKFMEATYRDYVPEGIPYEAVEIMRLFTGGGTFVPPEVASLDFDFDLDDEEEPATDDQ